MNTAPRSPLPPRGIDLSPDGLLISTQALGDALDALRDAVRAGLAARRQAVRAKARTGALKPMPTGTMKPAAAPDKLPRPADRVARETGPMKSAAKPAGWVPDILLEGLDQADEPSPAEHAREPLP